MLSYKILFLIFSLAILPCILSFVQLYLQRNQHPKVTKMSLPTPMSHNLLILPPSSWALLWQPQGQVNATSPALHVIFVKINIMPQI